MGKGGVPYLATHDGRTIRYPDPDIRVTHLSLGPVMRIAMAYSTTHHVQCLQASNA